MHDFAVTRYNLDPCNITGCVIPHGQNENPVQIGGGIHRVVGDSIDRIRVRNLKGTAVNRRCRVLSGVSQGSKIVDPIHNFIDFMVRQGIGMGVSPVDLQSRKRGHGTGLHRRCNRKTIRINFVVSGQREGTYSLVVMAGSTMRIHNTSHPVCPGRAVQGLCTTPIRGRKQNKKRN